MELLITILTWLGLITAGTTYADSDIRRIATENRSAVKVRAGEVLNATDKAQPMDGDWEMPYR